MKNVYATRRCVSFIIHIPMLTFSDLCDLFYTQLTYSYIWEQKITRRLLFSWVRSKSNTKKWNKTCMISSVPERFHGRKLHSTVTYGMFNKYFVRYLTHKKIIVSHQPIHNAILLCIFWRDLRNFFNSTDLRTVYKFTIKPTSSFF